MNKCYLNKPQQFLKLIRFNVTITLHSRSSCHHLQQCRKNYFIDTKLCKFGIQYKVTMQYTLEKFLLYIQNGFVFEDAPVLWSVNKTQVPHKTYLENT